MTKVSTRANGVSAEGLQLEGISKRFDGNMVLQDLSVTVEKGKLLSLLGPSGCGKSTTLNIVAGFSGVDTGRVLLDGTDITRLPPHRRDTTMVFQNYALFPHLTVFENVRYGLKAKRVDSQLRSARVTDMLEMLGIGPLADRYPGQLSGGQQQRVALARALAVEPGLLLLDEPLSNLDARLRQEIRIEIRNLQQRLKQTAIFVTHDQEEALVISDFVAVLNAGRLEQYGTPEELWEKPATPYVARFMGVENILPVVPTGRGGAILSGDMTLEVPFGVDGVDHIGFRPGHAQIAPRDATAPLFDGLSLMVTVASRAYLGDSVLYTCDLEGGSRLLVEQRSADMSLREGDKAEIRVERSRVIKLANTTHRDEMVTA